LPVGHGIVIRPGRAGLMRRSSGAGGGYPGLGMGVDPARRGAMIRSGTAERRDMGAPMVEGGRTWPAGRRPMPLCWSSPGCAGRPTSSGFWPPSWAPIRQRWPGWMGRAAWSRCDPGCRRGLCAMPRRARGLASGCRAGGPAWVGSCCARCCSPWAASRLAWRSACCWAWEIRCSTPTAPGRRRGAFRWAGGAAGRADRAGGGAGQRARAAGV